jgi:hypothetical protein
MLITENLGGARFQKTCSCAKEVILLARLFQSP